MAEHNRDAISSALLSSLGTVYDCKRTWSAWSQGAMGPEDFVPFDMQDDRIEEVVDAVIAALSSPLASDVMLQRLSERIDNIVSLAKVRFPDVITLESAWDALVSERNRLEAQLAQQAAKCDGNHGGPRCADPECWNDTPPASPFMSDADILVVAEFVGLVGPRSRVGEAHAAAVRFARAIRSLRTAAQEAVVRVCPYKDAECGDRPAGWCDTCPKHSACLSKPAESDRQDGLTLTAERQATPEPAPHPLAARCYTMSEPHLSGYRLILGFETLEAVDAAHTWVENVRKAHQQATPDHFPDAGNMAQAAPEPVGEPRGWAPPTEAEIDEYLEDYEMRGNDEDGRDACHTPTEGERLLIKDAIMGLLADTRPAPAAQAVPEGMAMVPVEPTVEMALAGADVIRNRARGKFVRYVMHDVWAAMLAAAPQVAGQAKGGAA